MNENENLRVNITDKVVNNLELPKLDVAKYIGQKSKIEKVEEFKGKFGYFLKITSETIDKITEILDKETGEPLELKASKVLGLFEDKDGKIGWNDGTKLGVFLKKMGVKHYNELVGKKIIIIPITNKKGNDYLSF